MASAIEQLALLVSYDQVQQPFLPQNTCCSVLRLTAATGQYRLKVEL